jgi:hypothetical protein
MEVVCHTQDLNRAFDGNFELCMENVSAMMAASLATLNHGRSSKTALPDWSSDQPRRQGSERAGWMAVSHLRSRQEITERVLTDIGEQLMAPSQREPARPAS